MSRAGLGRGPFPTLDTDLSGTDGKEAAAGGRPKRVCIATPDVAVAVRGAAGHGGIGAACRHLARLLAARGHHVTVVFVHRGAADARRMAEARAGHARFGAAFEALPPRFGSRQPLLRVAAPTWTLLEWLRRAPPFDVVHVPDRHGLGYGPMLAKSLGLAFGRTHFVATGHGPTLWAAEGNRRLLSSEHELGLVFLERRSIELADTVVCGSAHLLAWMREAGYALPARSFVWPNAFPPPDPAPEAAAARAGLDGAALEEVVFFGRLEPRKGLLLFADAISRLVRRGQAPPRVTFLGPPAGHFDGRALIRRATRDWAGEVRALTGLGPAEALARLARPGRLAVLPSLRESCSMAVLECLQAGIPFVAAASGGTPELVAPEDHGRALVAPDPIALAGRIAALAGGPLRAVRPRRDFAQTLDVWTRWHAQAAPFDAAAARFDARAREAAAATPPVTVCLVHHERPALLRIAADSVLAQDYPDLDAVLVDDGSESPAARDAVAAVEADFARRGWRVLRQENRYLGAARNAAAAAGRGEWLLFLDDDNVLLPDAVSRLVRAARFAGADCVPAACIRFSGQGDPRAGAASGGVTVRFVGAARAWSRVSNVVGDACALVRREAFDAVGGFSTTWGLGLEDLELFNRLMLAGRRIEPLPDPVYYYRNHPATSMAGMFRDPWRAEASRARALQPHLAGLPAEERAWAAYAAACGGSLEGRAARRLARLLAAAWRRTWPLRARWTPWWA